MEHAVTLQMVWPTHVYVTQDLRVLIATGLSRLVMKQLVSMVTVLPMVTVLAACVWRVIKVSWTVQTHSFETEATLCKHFNSLH